MSDSSAVLWVDRFNSIQVPGPADRDIVLHCAEGQDRFNRQPNAIHYRQNCIPWPMSEIDGLYERELFRMIGVEGWDGIEDLNSAAAFTEGLVALEGYLDESADIERMLNLYESAIRSRRNIAGSLKDSPRWEKIQIRVFERLRTDAQGEHPGAKDLVERFGQLYGEANGPREIEMPLFRLRWQHATSGERADLCEDRKNYECRDFYERLGKKERDALARRPSLTSKIIFPEPGRKDRIFGAGLGLGASIGHERAPMPQVELSLVAQAMSLIRFTAALSVTPDFEDKTLLVARGQFSDGVIRAGLDICARGYVGAMPWGEGVSLDAGGGVSIFEGRIDKYRQYAGQSTKYKTGSGQAVDYSPVVETGITVFPRESFFLRLHAITPPGDPREMSVVTSVGLHHWFL